MPRLQYLSRSGIGVTRTASKVPFKRGLRGLLRELDTRRGAYLSSGYEFPGRYSRWDIATVRPPIELVAFGQARRDQRPERARANPEPHPASRPRDRIPTGKASS